MSGRSRALVGLIAVLVFDVWLRGHTVGPTLHDRYGVSLYSVSGRESEPLDCDEAIYAYIGKRISLGAVMYRDLTENKPPGGYWIYSLFVTLGGANEFTVRLMPVPLVLGTICLVWWLGLRLRGPGAAVVAALIYAVVSTDPFLYANGANMEHMINLFATGSLALLVAAWDRPGRARIVAAGVCLGAAALVKQVAALPGPLYAAALMLRTSEGGKPRSFNQRIGDVAALTAGFVAVWVVSALVLVSQGAGRDAFEDIFRYGPALATDTPVDPNAPPFFIRWITGNADPAGKLPWPFGATTYLVWWGTGSWPVWIAAVPALGWLLFGKGASGPRRLVAGWTLAAWVEVALPRLFWQHYYLLPVPGLAVVIAVFLGDQLSLARSVGLKRWAGIASSSLTLLAVLWTVKIQYVEYLRIPPQELTVRDKGGGQWVVLRSLGREIARRSTVWERPTLYVWGWQSPLFFYSGLDGVTRQLFADDLIKNYAGKNHPLIRPRVDRTMDDLRRDPPSLIFTGYPPFPALRAFLEERYLRSNLVPVDPQGRGLWVERSKYGAFETFSVPTQGPSPVRQSQAGSEAAKRP